MKKKTVIPDRLSGGYIGECCPVCGKYIFTESHEICPVCGWENDRVQLEDPDFPGGSNKLSLNEARKKYEDENK